MYALVPLVVIYTLDSYRIYGDIRFMYKLCFDMQLIPMFRFNPLGCETVEASIFVVRKKPIALLRVYHY